MPGVGECTGHEAVSALRERYAERCRAHAAVLAAVWDVVTSVAPDNDFRRHGPDEFAADEVRAALGLTRTAAGRLVEEAAVMVGRLPGLHAAMAAGNLDEPRARLLAELTADLADSHALAVVEQLVPWCAPGAPGQLTTGKLAERIKALAIALDPQWAQRRYEASLLRRRVIGRREEEGTASLSGTHLPLERVAGSVAHIHQLASKAKAAGDPRPIDHIRSDLFLGMTDGTYTAMTEAEILDTLAVQPQAAPGRASRAGVHVKARLTTLVGLDRLPGELTGWGPIIDTHARDLVADLGTAQWRWTLVTPAGQHLRTGLTLARPTGLPRRDTACKAVVEIVITEAGLDHLAALDADALGPWQRVVDDLHRRRTRPVSPHPAHPRARLAGRRLRREITTAIPRCIGVGCRAPASGSQIDHLIEYRHGGVTLESNLDPACAHDHRLKTEAGWQLRRLDLDTGTVFEWTSRLRHVYREPVEPVLPPPPEPPPADDRTEPDDPDPPF